MVTPKAKSALQWLKKTKKNKVRLIQFFDFVVLVPIISSFTAKKPTNLGYQKHNNINKNPVWEHRMVNGAMNVLKYSNIY